MPAVGLHFLFDRAYDDLRNLRGGVMRFFAGKERFEHTRIGGAGRYREHAYSGRRQFLRERLAEVNNSRLRERIDGKIFHALCAGPGRYIHNTTGLLLAHNAQNFFCNIQRSFDIYVHNLLPVLGSGFFEGFCLRDSRIVHKHIYALEFLHTLTDRLFNINRFGNIPTDK